MLSIGLDSVAASYGEPRDPAQGRVRARQAPPYGGRAERGLSVPARDLGGTQYIVVATASDVPPEAHDTTQLNNNKKSYTLRGVFVSANIYG